MVYQDHLENCYLDSSTDLTTLTEGFRTVWLHTAEAGGDCHIFSQVSQLQTTAHSLAALQQQHEQLQQQVAECEKQAAVNSELRLIAVGLAELQQEEMQLRPLAEQTQELRRQNHDMEQQAATLPTVKVYS